ncbi:hypothetical protein PM082_022137 [Marasmius tenuissimus]|nr:hypothetical protein PM082_022137 [Marasmius tenuissimus]
MSLIAVTPRTSVRRQYGIFRATVPEAYTRIVRSRALQPLFRRPTSMITELPAETVLSILSYLPIPAIHCLQLASKHFQLLITDNEPTIYRFAAFHHHFIPSITVKIDQLDALRMRREIFVGMNREWKSFCQRMFQLDDRWRGRGPSTLAHYPSAGEHPAYIRVDEKEGLLISLKDVRGERPGLVVIDKVNGTVLWEQSWAVAQTFVIEYQSGYLILNMPEWREVWRLATIPDLCPPSPAQEGSFPYPHPQQVEISRKCYEAHRNTYPKGHFVPHAAFPYPSSARPFRMIFPTLLTLLNENEVLFYDIPSRRLTQTLLLCPDTMMTAKPGLESIPLPSLGAIWTIDMSPNHIILTSGESGSVRVFDRASGQCLLDMPNDCAPCKTIEIEDDDPQYVVYYPRRSNPSKLRWQPLKITDTPSQNSFGRFRDVSSSKKLRMSICGNHFVTFSSRRTNLGSGFELALVIVRNFTKIPPGETSLFARHAIQIMLGAQHATFAFDGHRRVLVAKRSKVIIFDISKFLESTGEVEAFSIPAFRRTEYVHTCELTESGIYFEWPADGVAWGKGQRNSRRRRWTETSICGVDFAIWEGS